MREILAQEQITADDDAIAIVAREAGGSLRDALTVLDQLLAFGGDALQGEEVARGLGIADQRSVVAVAEAVLGGDAGACLRAVSALGQQGLDVMHFARQLLSLMRDLVVLRVVGDSAELIDRPEQERQQLGAIAQAHGAQQLERSFSGLAKLVEEVGQSGSPQLTLEMGLVRLADRPPLEPLSELMARLRALEARLGGGGGGAAGAAGRGPGRTDAAGGARGPRRGAAQQAQGPHELRAPARLEPRRADPGAEPRRGRPSAGPARGPDPEPAPGAPEPAATSTVGDVPAPARHDTGADPGGGGDLPQGWHEIIAALHQSQPALGAVLAHGVPVRVDPSAVVVSFPEGSFFGRQAGAESARSVLADAAERVLGRRPRIEVGFGLASSRSTVAALEAEREQERRAQAVKSALSHPLVREAMDVFPEAEGNVDVVVED